MALTTNDYYAIWRDVFKPGASKARFKAESSATGVSRDQVRAALDGLEDALTAAATAHKTTFDTNIGFTTTVALYRDFVMALLRNKAGRG